VLLRAHFDDHGGNLVHADDRIVDFHASSLRQVRSGSPDGGNGAIEVLTRGELHLGTLPSVMVEHLLDRIGCADFHRAVFGGGWASQAPQPSG
jgi:hypothetical protein